MPLFVAHGLLGASVVAVTFERSPADARRDLWRDLWLGALLGICPDFDYALNLAGLFGTGWHHGFTHSILFAVIVGAAAAKLAGSFRLRRIAAYGGAVLSHTLLDLLVTRSRGIELLAPFSDRRFRLALDHPLDYSWNTLSVSGAALDLLRISFVESVLFAPVLLAALLLSGRLNRRRSTR